jgi:predicted RNase H-like nuclease (RuvC/YqgF family)
MTALSAQDSQTLGDAARQSRLHKQQKDVQAGAISDASGNDSQGSTLTSVAHHASKAPHVITDDEMPSHPASGTMLSPTSDASRKPSGENSRLANQQASAEQWKSQILAQKSAIASMQAEISNLNESIHYAGRNCVSNCVKWNEHQKEKQDRVEIMQSQLQDQQKHLEEMQETARKQGFGSSVYEP